MGCCRSLGDVLGGVCDVVGACVMLGGGPVRRYGDV